MEGLKIPFPSKAESTCPLSKRHILKYKFSSDLNDNI